MEQVVTSVKQSAEALITQMLSAYDDVRLVMKTFMLGVVMIAVKERPERIAEVVDAILRIWDRETDEVKNVTLKLLSAAAEECPAIADEGFKVALRGLEDTDPGVKGHAMCDIYKYARSRPRKANEVIDTALAGIDDLCPKVSSEPCGS